jgi:hypothetical protein
VSVPLMPEPVDDGRGEILGPAEVLDNPGLICGPRVAEPGCALHPLTANPYCPDCRTLGDPDGPGWVGVL